MIPVRDVVPSRTRPSLTLALIAVGLVATALGSIGRLPDAADGPARRALGVVASVVDHGSWAAVLANSLLLWLLGPAVEDRAGHGRFLLLSGLCGLAAVTALSLIGLTSPWPAVAGATTAGVAAAHLTMFPASKVLAVAPALSGWTVLEWPSTFVAAVWLLGPVADALGLFDLNAPLPAGAPLAGALAGAATGALAITWLRRPERLRVEWWDTPAGPDRT